MNTGKNLGSQKLLQILNFAYKAMPKGTMTDGILLGLLIGQNTDRFKQSIEYVSSMRRILSPVSPCLKLAKYAEYYPSLAAKIHTFELTPIKKRLAKEENKASGEVGDDDSDSDFDLIVKNKPGSNLKCTLCNDKVQDTSVPQPCGHSYHPQCLQKYLKQKLKQAVYVETCFHKNCDEPLKREKIVELCDEQEVLKHDTLKFLIDVANCRKVVPFWCRNCRKFFVQKRNLNGGCESCARPCERMRKALTLTTKHHPDGNIPKEVQERHDMVMQDAAKQIQRCMKCMRWKHKLTSTNAYLCKCNQQFL